MVNADQPMWLIGMTEMTRTFGLELMESLLTTFPKVFIQVCFAVSFAQVKLGKHFVLKNT